MQGFIYIWHDKVRNMFYIGSHEGTPDDGYISSSTWFNAEYRFRPKDFRRKIIKFIDLNDMKIEEYRLIKMIQENEFGKKYYNLRSGRKPGSSPWNKGKTNIYTPETIDRMSKAKIGNTNTKGMKMPKSADNARKGASKLSANAKGRKLHTREDGTKYWIYPKAN